MILEGLRYRILQEGFCGRERSMVLSDPPPPSWHIELPVVINAQLLILIVIGPAGRNTIKKLILTVII